jgi:hypothetical protein
LFNRRTKAAFPRGDQRHGEPIAGGSATTPCTSACIQLAIVGASAIVRRITFLPAGWVQATIARGVGLVVGIAHAAAQRAAVRSAWRRQWQG